jgi:hypothetical protein
MSLASSRLCFGAAKGLFTASLPQSQKACGGGVLTTVVRGSKSLHALRNLSLTRGLYLQNLSQKTSGLSITGLQLDKVITRRSISVQAVDQQNSDSRGKMAAPKEISSTKHSGGFNKRYEHDSSTIGVPMKFTVYLPPAAEKGKVAVSA